MLLDFLPALVMAVVLTVWLRRFARVGVTDFAWFWVGLFSGAALLGICAIAPKYAKREARLELNYIGRQRAVPSAAPEINGSGQPTVEELQQDPQLASAPQEPPSGLIVPLWYLAGIIGIVFATSSVFLYRQIAHEKQTLKATNPSTPLQN